MTIVNTVPAPATMTLPMKGTGPLAAAVAPVLAQATSQPAFTYQPFLKPLPVWGDGAWPWLLLPLCLGVAVVYKTIKCRTARQVPKEAVLLTIWIVAGMLLAALVLAALVEGLERAST